MFKNLTGTKEILCMVPKYIILHGFRPPLVKKYHNFGPKTIIFHYSKIHIFRYLRGFGGQIEILRQVLIYDRP